MPLTKFQFRPGVSRDITSYSNEGGWFDCDKIRFRAGFPEKIGGWARLGSSTFLGSCRSMHFWRTLGLNSYIGVGTNLKFYIEYGTGYYDITPIRKTSPEGDATFSAVDGSSEITVTDADHGAVLGDFVTFSAAGSLGGNITASVLSQEYQIDSVINEDSYTVLAREVASVSSITVQGVYTPTLVQANASDTGDGGAVTVATYQANSGLDTVVFGTGWGAGTWSRAGWGDAASVNLETSTLRLWTQDNFGEDLLLNIRNGGIYYWDTSAGLNFRAIPLSDLSGSNGAPTIAAQVLVSDADRHVLAFGCDPVDNPGVQDPLLIRFSSQEDATSWVPEPTNTAGDLRIGSGSSIVRAVETRQQIIIFTDTSLHAMQFLGPPFTFGLSKISENVTIQSPNATVAVDDRVFWMGLDEFYLYEGTVRRIPCLVRDYVFNDLNQSQSDKVFAASNAAFGEVWWFYPSSDSDDINRYVVFNYEQSIWYYGSLSRTAWLDRGAQENPVAAGPNGAIYNHETGQDNGETIPPSPISAFISSSPVDIQDGQDFVHISRMLPDISFVDSTAQTPEVTISTTVQNYLNGPPVRSTDSTVDSDTQQVNLRLRGRQLSTRVESDGLGVSWRLGTTRYDIRADGRR